MRAIAHVQSRLAKLCSVGKRSGKSGYRCLIQPPAQYSVLPAARCQFAPFTEGAAEPSTHHKHLATYCRTGGRRTAWFSNERQSPAQLTQMIHPHIKPVSERTTCLKPILLHHLPAKRAPETNMLSGTELVLLPAFDTADIAAITSTVPPGLGRQAGKQTEGCHRYLELDGSYSKFIENERL